MQVAHGRFPRSALRTSFAAGGMIGLAAALLVGLGSSPAPAAKKKAAAKKAATCTERQITTSEAFQVPGGVRRIEIDAWGAQGGDLVGGGGAAASPGGRGGAAIGTVLAVNPGDQVGVIVGLRGGDVSGNIGVGTPGAGGFGGGGDGGPGNAHNGGGGGGASTVLHNGQAIVIAGGGGGGAHGSQADEPGGGFGGHGGLNGTNGTGALSSGIAQPGLGATTTAGGAGGVGDGPAGGLIGGTGTSGIAGQGGNGGDGPQDPAASGGSDGGGGGGGGLFGGGGGGGGNFGGGSGAGGGGGSSMGQPGTQFQTGVQEGDGRVEIRYPLAACRHDLRKTADSKVVAPGGKVRWTLTVRNRTDVPARNVRLCDVLNKRTTVVNRGGGKLVAKGKRLCWTIKRLAPGQRKRRRFVTTIDPASRQGGLCNQALAKSKGVGGDRAKACVRVARRSARVSPVTG